MRIGSALLAIWLVVGGVAAGQRGDYKGPFGCSGASTIAVTILAGPLNFAGLKPHVNCTVSVMRKPASERGPSGPSRG